MESGGMSRPYDKIVQGCRTSCAITVIRQHEARSTCNLQSNEKETAVHRMEECFCMLTNPCVLDLVKMST